MPARRRRHALAVLCAALLAGLGTAALAGAQSTTVPDLSQVPQLGPGTTTTEPAPTRTTSTTSPATTTARTAAAPPARTAATTATTPVAPRAQTLPATGMDGRILAGLGAGLLLCGIGLRMRTRRERF